MAGRRCDVLDVREMLRRLRLGESARAVAKGLGVSRNTVREYVAWFEAERLLPGDAAALPSATDLDERLARAEPVAAAAAAHAVPRRDRRTGRRRPAGQGRLGAVLVGAPGRARELHRVPPLRAPVRRRAAAPRGRTTRGRPGRGGAGGLRLRGPHAARAGRGAGEDLGLRDDALAQPPPVRRARAGPDRRDLARAAPQRVRVLRRRPAEDRSRQPQGRDRQGVGHRSRGPARLPRVRRALRLRDLAVRRARPPSTRARSSAACST